MQTIFYILIYLTVNCGNPFMITNEPVGSANHTYREQSLSGFQFQCDKPSQVEMVVEKDLDFMVKSQNCYIKKECQSALKLPDKIYKVTLKHGEFIYKEVKIVPVIKKTKIQIEQEKEVIEGYKIE
jgi:hypothetical protein